MILKTGYVFSLSLSICKSKFICFGQYKNHLPDVSSISLHNYSRNKNYCDLNIYRTYPVKYVGVISHHN